MFDTSISPGVEPSRLHVGLLVGDVSVIALLLFGGMLRHHRDPLAMPERFALVVGPFVLGWVVASALTGAYTARARGSVAAAVGNAAGTWIVAALGGAGLRATAVFPGESPATFVGVVLGTGVLALGLWRGLVTAAVGPAGD